MENILSQYRKNATEGKVKKNIFLIVLSFLLRTSIFSFQHDHSLWGKTLDVFVKDQGKTTIVDYRSLKENSFLFEEYLEDLSGVTQDEFNGWEKEEQLAFLINAYNAFTVKLIIDNYPLKSIKDLGGLFSNPWKKKFFTLFGEKTYLDHIEHDLIRKKFKEPRIHAAVNCASISCPKLSKRAYVAKNLEEQLEEAMKEFMQDENRNHLLKDKLYLSSIFKWYGRDFGEKEKEIKDFLWPYFNFKEEEKSLYNRARIKYLPYNWSLND